MSAEPLHLMQDMYAAMIAAADPFLCVPPALPVPPKGRTVVVGMGKAAAAMAAAVESVWPSSAPLSGVVVVPEGAGLPLQHIRCMEAAHPMPDERSIDAGSALLEAVQNLGPDDLVLALISGGGSSLAVCPAAGIDLQTKQNISRALMQKGAPISAINTVRKHLSKFKGGHLAAAIPYAKLVTLVISDIPGDNVADVASGPTIADASTCSAALAVLKRYDIAISSELEKKLLGGELETPKPATAKKHEVKLIATARTGLNAASKTAEKLGWKAQILSDSIEGEARDIALMHAALAKSVRDHNEPFAAPCVLLSGGEATVIVRGSGKGGRNTEFALAIANELQGEPGIWACSAGTDGNDGSADAAGAWVSPAQWDEALSLGLYARDYLDANDSANYFRRLNALMPAKVTHTNINDFRAVVICSASASG